MSKASATLPRPNRKASANRQTQARTAAPDTNLIGRVARLERFIERMESRRIPDSAAAQDRQVISLCERFWRMVEPIEATRESTLAGLQAKIRTLYCIRRMTGSDAAHYADRLFKNVQVAHR